MTTNLIKVNTENRKETLISKIEKNLLQDNKIKSVFYCTSFEELTENIIAYTARCSDYKVYFKELDFVKEFDSYSKPFIRLKYRQNSYRLMPTFFHTFSQFVNFSSCLNGVTSTILRSFCIPEFRQNCKDDEDLTLVGLHLLRHIISHLREEFCTRRGEQKQVLFRTISDSSNQHYFARALLSANYRTDLNCLWLITIIPQLMSIPSRVNYYFNGHLLELELPIDSQELVDVAQDKYCAGFYFYCGEVGNRSLGVIPYVSIQDSGRGFFGEEISISHNSALTLEDCLDYLKNGIEEQLPLLTNYINNIMKLLNIVFTPKTKDPNLLERILIVLSSHFKLTFKDLRIWRECYYEIVEDYSQIIAHDLYESFIRAVSKIDDSTKRFQLNKLSKNLVNLDWNQLAYRFETVSDKQVNKVFKLNQD